MIPLPVSNWYNDWILSEQRACSTLWWFFWCCIGSKKMSKHWLVLHTIMVRLAEIVELYSIPIGLMLCCPWELIFLLLWSDNILCKTLTSLVTVLDFVCFFFIPYLCHIDMIETDVCFSWRSAFFMLHKTLLENHCSLGILLQQQITGCSLWELTHVPWHTILWSLITHGCKITNSLSLTDAKGHPTHFGEALEIPTTDPQGFYHQIWAINLRWPLHARKMSAQSGKPCGGIPPGKPLRIPLDALSPVIHG